MVWDFHFFKDFPHFIVIYTVKGFSLENYKLFSKTEKKPKDSGLHGMAKDNSATSPKTILLKQQNPENSLQQQILGTEN